MAPAAPPEMMDDAVTGSTKGSNSTLRGVVNSELLWHHAKLTQS